MNNLIRTTINLPQDLYSDMRLYAASKNISLSQLVRQTVSEKLGKPQGQKSILDLAGSLSLKGKTPPSRYQLYHSHVSRKMGL